MSRFSSDRWARGVGIVDERDEGDEGVDDVDHEVHLMSEAAAATEGLPARMPPAAIDHEELEFVQGGEIADDAFLADAFQARPEDRLALFDLVGDPMGYGLRDGMTEDGRTRILLPAVAIDVVGSAKDTHGQLIDRPVFALIPPAPER
jgi:hypothetical protein